MDRDAYLLTLCRYVELNPVRAELCRTAKDWVWSSYRAHVGLAVTPDWLDSDGLHGYLLGRDVRSAQDRQQTASRCAALVNSSPDLQTWAEGLRQQIFLGDENFVLHMQALMAAPHAADKKISKPQRLLTHKPLQAWLEEAASREEGLFKAHTQGGLWMTAMARTLGVSVSLVSRLIARHEGQRR